MFHSARRVAVALIMAGTATTVAPRAARADKLSDLQRERRDNQAKQARTAARVDMLTASDAEVQRALDAINADVSGQRAAVAAARQAGAAATAEAARARAAQHAAEARLADLHGRLRSMAVAAYVEGPSRQLALTLDAGSLHEAARRRQLYDIAAGRTGEVVDQVRATTEDLTHQREEADAAVQRAAARKADEEAALARLTGAQERQRKAAAAAEARLDAALAEADALSSVDQQLAAHIADEQAAIAARLAAARAAAAAATRAAGAPGRAPRALASVAVTTVRGITVNVSIASQLDAMLGAAEADGFVFGGGGYRSSDSQIVLREAHCGSSDYAIYDMPPSACRPPTARPGSSMHEQGLAVDFTWNGSAIASRGSPAFQWLAGHAGAYGLFNLPSEPWHWSTNGN